MTQSTFRFRERIGSLVSVAGLFFVCTLILCRPLKSAAAERQDEFRWNGAVPAGQSIEIKGINGSIRAEETTGSQVELVAEKKGHRSDPKQVQIEVVNYDQGVT